MNRTHDYDKQPAGHDRLQAASLTADRQEGSAINVFKDGQNLQAPSVTELNLSHMAQRRGQTHAQVAQAAEELERLHGKREELERERQRLEKLEKRQVKYEKEQGSLHEGLTYRMELLQKMDLEASRRAELFAAVRRRYEEMLREVEQLHENQWTEERYDEELNRSLALLEDIQREYHRAWSRVEAVTNKAAVEEHAALPLDSAVTAVPGPRDFAARRDFIEWVVVGAAFSLPLILVVALLFLLTLWL